MTKLSQWDVVRVRINPEDRDMHPAVLISREEVCRDERKARLNVLYGTTRRPGDAPDPLEVQLNGADGLERPTLFTCAHIYTVSRRNILQGMGRVTPERRRQIGRKIAEAFRLPL